MVTGLSDAWALAQDQIKLAQQRQKHHYDKRSKEQHYKVGDRVMVYMPNAKKGKAWKLARPFYGPYRVLSVTPTNVEVHPVDRPSSDSIFVSLDRVRPSYPELPDVSWCGGKKSKRAQQRRPRNPRKELVEDSNNHSLDLPGSTRRTTRTVGPVTRSMTRQVGVSDSPLVSC